MRLPRSSSPNFSVRFAWISIVLAFVALLPLSALAATQQVVCTPAKLRFGAVSVGQSQTQLVALTNTGTTSTTVSAISMGGAAFRVSGVSLPLTLAAGQSVALNVIFSPTGIGWTGWTQGKVTFTGKSSNPSAQMWFAGSGVTNELLTAKPASLSFGQKTVGTSTTLPIVLTNGRSHAQTLTAIQTLGSNFSVSAPSMPATLAPGQSVTLNVTFTPKATGTNGGSIFLSGPSLNLPLSGTGTGTTIGLLTISPAKLTFGKVLVGETGTQAAVFTATGGSVTISSASSSSGQFALPGSTFPMTIAAGQSIQMNVVFAPQKAGAASATLSFSSNASDGQASEALAGTGAMPQVSLGWSASTSSVQGYNVYRGTSPGAYSKINAKLDTATSYTDTTVASGTTYYYAATAVDVSGQESGYSAPAAITVP